MMSFMGVGLIIQFLLSHHTALKMSASVSSVKEVPAQADDKAVLNVLLNCELTKSSETKQIYFKSLPTTPLEIKKKIEEDFSIPSCVQTLHYQSMILKDSDQLQHTHFRSGDTFTVDYPTEADCKITQNVIKWLKELFELLQSTEEFESSSSSDEDSDYLKSSTTQKILNLILEGDRDGIMEALTRSLFFPYGDKKKLMNKFYFQQEGGLDLLMKIYGVLVRKDWSNLGIDTESQVNIYLEHSCCDAIWGYVETFSLRRQVVELGGLEMSTVTLLRRQLSEDGSTLNTHMYNTLRSARFVVCGLSELPECQVPLARRTDVIDQMLAMALHPTYGDCKTAIESMETIINLTQSPETHLYIIRREVLEKVLEICELKQMDPQTQQVDAMIVNALKFYTSITLAQVGLGSPHLLFDSIPPHLLRQILNLMSDMLETASLAEIRQYEKKMATLWGTFLPYLQYLYKPLVRKNVTTDDRENTKAELYISCCNVLLHGLENALDRDVHLEVLVKEGLLDYTMCLPTVLPGECQPRARSLVNELGKHRQLQPPSLCTLAKAHIAKTFCGLQPVMEMNSIGEFLHKHFPASQ